jgi:hypothetical protein
MTTQSGIPISEKDLAKHRDSANRFLNKIEWQTRMSATERAAALKQGWAENVLPNPKNDVSIHQSGFVLSDDALLLSNDVNTVMDVIRDGIAAAAYVEEYIGNQVGMEDLNAGNQRGTLTNDKQTERTAKLKTLATVRLFVLAHYVTWHLHDFHLEARAGKDMSFPGLPEVNTQGPEGATKCALYYYGAFVKQSGVVNTPLELIQFTLLYFEALLAHLDAQVIPSLEFADTYTTKKFTMEGSDFSLVGFEHEYAATSGGEEVSPIEFSNIIGNHTAKSVLMRTTQMLFLYDIDARVNPFEKIGGFPSIVLMQGKPGTGKTLMIRAIVTRAKRYAAKNGMPIRIMPMPRDLISKYQGVSGERMKRYMDSLRDPKFITIAYADDAEHYFQDRGSEQVSEGAQAIDYGNLLFIIATNFPEIIDGAVMNRIQERFEVSGAETENDYIDYIEQEFRNTRIMFNDVASLKVPADYVLWSDQLNEAGSAPKKKRIEVATSTKPRIAKILATVSGRYQSSEYRFYGQLLKLAQEEFPQFSLRDVRNIVKAAKMELAGFEIPLNWTEDRSVYIDQPLSVKQDLLVAEMSKYLNEHDVDFPEILRSNVVRYLENYEAMNGVQRERAITKRAEEMTVYKEAQSRIGA